VANALGDPSRRYDSTTLDALARKVGATRIVRGFVEVRRNELSMTVVVDTVPLDESKRTLKTLTEMRFDAAHTARGRGARSRTGDHRDSLARDQCTHQ
jgi:hypothetical protein